MPGLADMHTHPGDGGSEDLKLFIANGVTTIRAMFSSQLVNGEWREQIANGEMIGPTIYTSGPTGEGKSPFWPGRDEDDVRKNAKLYVSYFKDNGFDFVKVLSHMSPFAYDEIMNVAKEMEIPVVGHVPITITLEHAIESGQRSIEHFSGYEFALMKVEAPDFDRTTWTASSEAWTHFEANCLAFQSDFVNPSVAVPISFLATFRCFSKLSNIS